MAQPALSKVKAEKKQDPWRSNALYPHPPVHSTSNGKLIEDEPALGSLLVALLSLLRRWLLLAEALLVLLSHRLP